MDYIQRRKFLRKKTLIPGTIIIPKDEISVEIDSLSGNGATVHILNFPGSLPNEFYIKFSFSGRNFNLKVNMVWEKRDTKFLDIGIRFIIDSKSRDFIVEKILSGLLKK